MPQDRNAIVVRCLGAARDEILAVAHSDMATRIGDHVRAIDGSGAPAALNGIVTALQEEDRSRQHLENVAAVLDLLADALAHGSSLELVGRVLEAVTVGAVRDRFASALGVAVSEDSDGSGDDDVELF